MEELIMVKVVATKGGSSLVEWGNCRRAYVPAEAVIDGKVDAKILEWGVPYGVPWERVKLCPEVLARLVKGLHAKGIWTAEDLSRNQKGAIDALVAAYGVDLASLNALAREEE